MRLGRRLRGRECCPSWDTKGLRWHRGDLPHDPVLNSSRKKKNRKNMGLFCLKVSLNPNRRRRRSSNLDPKRPPAGSGNLKKRKNKDAPLFSLLEKNEKGDLGSLLHFLGRPGGLRLPPLSWRSDHRSTKSHPRSLGDSHPAHPLSPAARNGTLPRLLRNAPDPRGLRSR